MIEYICDMCGERKRLPDCKRGSDGASKLEYWSVAAVGDDFYDLCDKQSCWGLYDKQRRSQKRATWEAASKKRRKVAHV